MKSEHPSAFVLDGLALGSLSPEIRAQSEAHVGSCERCRADVERARASRERFDRVVLPATLDAVKGRALRASFWRRWALPAALVPAAGIALALLLLRPTPAPDGLGIKGGATLQVFAHRGGRTFAVPGGSRLRAGDGIRFVVQPGGLSHVLVVSIDGAKRANVYVPYGGPASLRIDPAARAELPGSITLDASPGPERIFALFSAEPIPAERALGPLRALGARGPEAVRSEGFLPLQDATAQASVLIEKETP